MFATVRPCIRASVYRLTKSQPYAPVKTVDAFLQYVQNCPDWLGNKVEARTDPDSVGQGGVTNE